ncbi:MAG: molybdopterin oxidoreductase family protein [Pirellulales bacterium]
MSDATRLRICPLCEATCGLELAVLGRTVQSVRGDRDDSFSHGFVCPKGVAIRDLDADPDRLREPMIRHATGWRKATWDEAFRLIADRLPPIIDRYGKNAVGLYLGNPTVHNTSLMLYAPILRKALGTQNVFTASSVDQLPKQLAVGLMFGNGLSIPIPDIDRCHYLLVLGANPLVSNGSLMTAPNIGKRLRRLQERGGKLVVIDPCRTRTAKAADAYHPIRPGTDALLLFAIVHTLFDEGLVTPGRLEPHITGLAEVARLANRFPPETVADHCGIAADVIRRLAGELAEAKSAALYGRIGTCTQRFGTLASWLIEVLHVLTGNLDRPGGAMFTKPAHGAANTKGPPGSGRGLRVGRWTSRVRGCAEIFGELPSACLAEEIETAGDGQIRAMITVAGNPLLSLPNSDRLARAFASLDLMVSLDLYLNETTRYANVILPGLSPLETEHYDVVFSQLAIRNLTRYSPPVFEPPQGQPAEWESILRIVAILAGQGPQADIGALDDAVLLKMIQREARSELSCLHGRDPGEIMAALGPRRGPARMTDLMLRCGPYGDGFGSDPDGLRLALLEDHPHGVDLGPLEPRIPEVLRTPTGKIELAPESIIRDVRRLETARDQRPAVPDDSLLLIGRRHLRSNNSWMHNLERLATGDRRCTLQLHPADAGRLGIADAELVRVTSRVGAVEIQAEITEAIVPGVVSLPHGWGHDDPLARLSIAREKPGANSNRLTDDTCLDVPSGNAVLCGIPVRVKPIASV